MPNWSSDVQIFLFCLLLLDGCAGYVMVCYYTNWSQFRNGPGRFLPDDVDPSLCTHIVFAFGEVQGTAIHNTVYNDEAMYKRLTTLKEDHPELRVLLALGGWQAGGEQFSSLVASENTMGRFVRATVAYLRRFGLDGVDVDWEFPGDTERGSEPADRVRFTRLLQLLREGFEREAEETGNDRLLLTAAVAAEIESARQYYQIPQIARSVDLINLMAYDFYGHWDLSSGSKHHTALYPDTHNAVEGWLQDGFPPEKMALGMAAFARTFSLAAAPQGTGLGQTVTGVGSPGAFSASEGILTYQEVCDRLLYGGWQRVWLEEQQAPAAFGNNTDGTWEWAGYDDVDSVIAKANYIKDRGLAGAMVWSMDNDDFNNHCGQGAWPLLTTLRQYLPDDSAGQPETPPSPKPATPAEEPPFTMPFNNTRWWTTTTTTTTPRTRKRPTTGTGSSSTSSTPVEWPPTGRPDSGPGYRQCSISDSFGPTLRCSGDHGKPGSRSKFYLYCFHGFFAIECSCLPGFFYNRCLQTCDADSNFLNCPFRY